jgi:acyl-coenzyme A thioesterase PaaI-like protein
VRPGGTVAGPALFALADVALYAAVLSRIGPVELAVTTSMTINFLRKPAPRPVIAEARLLQLGRRLAYGEVLLLSDGEADPVAHATGTYSIPPDRPSP